MNDRIFINDLEVFASHGVYDHEREISRRFLISVSAAFDASYAKTFDQIDYTVDYSKLANTIINFVQKNSFHLLERLAEQIASKIFRDFELITNIDITVKKFPRDMSDKNFASIGFSSSFSRNDE